MPDKIRDTVETFNKYGVQEAETSVVNGKKVITAIRVPENAETTNAINSLLTQGLVVREKYTPFSKKNVDLLDSRGRSLAFSTDDSQYDFARRVSEILDKTTYPKRKQEKRESGNFIINGAEIIAELQKAGIEVPDYSKWAEKTGKKPNSPGQAR